MPRCHSIHFAATGLPSFSMSLTVSLFPTTTSDFDSITLSPSPDISGNDMPTPFPEQRTSRPSTDLSIAPSISPSIDASLEHLKGTLFQYLVNISPDGGRLRRMLLQNNHLSGTIPISFRDLNRLNILRLEGNAISGISSEGACTCDVHGLSAMFLVSLAS